MALISVVYDSESIYLHVFLLISLDGQFTRLAIAEFVSKMKHPPVSVFTVETVGQIFENPTKQVRPYVKSSCCTNNEIKHFGFKMTVNFFSVMAFHPQVWFRECRIRF